MQSNCILNDKLESMEEGSFSLDQGGRVVELNNQAARIVNRKSEEIIGKVLWEEVPGFNGTELELSCYKALKNRVPRRIELEFLGSWYSIFLYPTEERIFTYWQNISEQKRIMEAEEETEKKYKTLFNSIDQGFFIIDVIFDENDVPVNLHYIEANEASKKILGMDYTGKLIKDINPNYEDYWCDIFGKVAKTGESVRLERYAGPDKKWYSFYLFKIGDENSRRIGNIFLDITESRKTVEQLRESEEQHIIDLEKLQQSEKKARSLIEQLRKADQNKNEFLSTMSHELRNPMASIVMSLSLLDHVSPGEEKAKQTIEIMKRQAFQLSSLIEDLLEITRINRSKIQLKKERIELNELVDGVVEDWQVHFFDKEVGLEVEMNLSPIVMEADPVRLTQIFGNLMHNAVKFTEKGGKTFVTVSKDESKGRAIITIRDTGIGIEPELLSDLFHPFFQADNTLNRSQGGLGLGLSVVKGLVDLHNGSVSVESEGLGKGAKFTIYLPLLQATGSKEMEDNPLQVEPYRYQKILVIEDNPCLLELTCDLLSILDYQTIAALNGPEGIAKAKEFKPEVIISDIGLPGMNGYEVARNIREDDELKEVYLIAMTGYADANDVDRAMEAGFNVHLAKPVELEVLKRVLVKNPMKHRLKER